MTVPLLLASSSPVRAALLRNAGVAIETYPPRVDEDAVKAAMIGEAAPPRDIADALAGLKAERVANRNPGAMVLGCDQVLDCDGKLLSKPTSEAAARAQLLALRGRRHMLHSAVVLYDRGQPVWRHIGTARLQMRAISDEYLDRYIARNWPGIGQCAGAYKLEEEGARLFSRIDGDYFSVLGLPLLELLTHLSQIGFLDT